MAAASLSQPGPAGKPRAWHCTYLGISGVLTKSADRVLFLEPSGQVTPLTPEEVLRDTVVNGEVATAMEQYLEDMAAGGYLALALARNTEHAKAA